MEALAQQLPQGDLMEIAATDSSTVSRLLKPSLGPPVRIVSTSLESRAPWASSRSLLAV